MNIPKEIIYGDVLLRISGNYDILIENYRSILLYTDTEVAIACKKMTLRIYGNQLHIQYFSGSDMRINGKISTITYIMNGDL